MTRTATTRYLILPLAALWLGAACSPDRAVYVLDSDPADRMMIGPANGEVVVHFYLGDKQASVPLAAVLEFAHFQRFDEQRRPVGPDLENAPAYIRIEGLHKLADAPDGEWTLTHCEQ